MRGSIDAGMFRRSRTAASKWVASPRSRPLTAALDRSDTWWAPSVSCHTSHESGVPKHRSRPTLRVHRVQDVGQLGGGLVGGQADALRRRAPGSRRRCAGPASPGRGRPARRWHGPTRWWRPAGWRCRPPPPGRGRPAPAGRRPARPRRRPGRRTRPGRGPASRAASRAAPHGSRSRPDARRRTAPRWSPHRSRGCSPVPPVRRCRWTQSPASSGGAYRRTVRLANMPPSIPQVAISSARNGKASQLMLSPVTSRRTTPTDWTTP